MRYFPLFGGRVRAKDPPLLRGIGGGVGRASHHKGSAMSHQERFEGIPPMMRKAPLGDVPWTMSASEVP